MRKTLLVVLLATGCASVRNEQIKTALQDQNAACLKSFQDSSVEPLRAQIPVLRGAQQAGLEALTDQRRATDEQRPAILALDRLTLACAEGIAKVFVAYGGDAYLPVFQRLVLRGQANRAELYKGTITFGEFNSNIAALQADYVSDVQNIDRQQAGLATQRSIAASQAISAGAAALQTIPRPLNCTTVGTGTMASTRCY